VEDMRFEGGVFSTAKSSKTVKFNDVALEAYICRNLPPGLEPGLVATRFFEPANFAFPFGAHIAQVEVDKETGEIEILRYIAVDDCGKVINPLLVDGQVHGGVAQGLGQAIFEEAVYDDDGQLITGELMTYAIPKAHHVPEIESYRTETPSPVNPLGAKGVGEAGTIGASPSLVNAVVDALSPLGVRHIDMPMTPQKVWRILSQKRS
jgi:carbon-monoxide dehydrogenase large subunit